jgi:hypothetical protein
MRTRWARLDRLEPWLLVGLLIWLGVLLGGLWWTGP